MSRSTDFRRRRWAAHALFGAVACLLLFGVVCTYEPLRLSAGRVSFGVVTTRPHTDLHVAWTAVRDASTQSGSFALGSVGAHQRRYERANGERVEHPFLDTWTFSLDVRDANGPLSGSRCVTQLEIRDEQRVDILFVEGSSCSGSSGGSSRPSQDLIAFYAFEEGAGTRVWDLSNFGEPLDLTLDPRVARWVDDEDHGRGLDFAFPTSGDLVRIPARSGIAAAKLEAAVAEAGQLTVEAWLQPADAAQAGPARVVTSSLGLTSRNLTLGQQGDHWIVRLRTDANPSASSPQLESDPGSASPALLHAVYVWDGQRAELFVGGESRGTIALPGPATLWDDYELALGNELGLPAGEERAWRGRIFLLALYRRALSAVEIGQLYQMGPAS